MAKAKSILDQICTPAEAAAILDLSRERVLQFCREGRLVARMLDRQWVIELASLKKLEKLPMGRPKTAVPEK